MTDKALSSLTNIGTLADADTGDEIYIVKGGNSRRAALGPVAGGMVLAADLASTAAGKGAALVGYEGGGTVQSVLEGLATDIAALDAAIVLKGVWDASSGV